MSRLAAALLLDVVPDGERRAVLDLMEAEYLRGLAEGAALHAAEQSKWFLSANPELPTGRVTQGRTGAPGMPSAERRDRVSKRLLGSSFAAETERARIARRPGFPPFWCDGGTPGGVNLRCRAPVPHAPHDGPTQERCDAGERPVDASLTDAGGAELDDFCIPCRAHELVSTIWWQRPDAQRGAGKVLGWLLRLTCRVPDRQRCASHERRKAWTRPIL